MGKTAVDKARDTLHEVKAKAEQQAAKVEALQSEVADLESTVGQRALEAADLGSEDAAGMIARQLRDLRDRLEIEQAALDAMQPRVADAKAAVRRARAGEYRARAGQAVKASEAHNQAIADLLVKLQELEGCQLTRPTPIGGIPKSAELAIDAAWLADCAEAVEYGETLPPRPEMPPAIDLWPH